MYHKLYFKNIEDTVDRISPIWKNKQNYNGIMECPLHRNHPICRAPMVYSVDRYHSGVYDTVCVTKC